MLPVSLLLYLVDCLCFLQVPVTGGVDAWLAAIKDTVSASLRYLLQQIVQDVVSGVSCEEWVQKVSTLYFSCLHSPFSLS